MDQFINQPVVNWAQQYLPQPVEVKLKEHKILVAVCFGILGLVFGGIALLFYVNAFSALVTRGFGQLFFGPFLAGTFFLIVFAALSGGLMLLKRITNRTFVKYMSANGVQTVNGRQYNWSGLYYLDYKKVRNARVSYGGAGLAGRVVSGLATSAAQSAIYAGHEKVTVELVFANGKALVPPLILDQPQILTLLNSMPVERRDEGTVRQYLGTPSESPHL